MITLSLPKPQDHLPKQPHRPARKPGAFNSVTRRLHNLRLVAARVNAGRVTVAGYLTGLGADADTIRRYASVLGKHVKAAYAAKFDAEPARDGLAVVGRHLARCFAYEPGDTEILRTATAGYGQVAHLLNGA